MLFDASHKEDNTPPEFSWVDSLLNASDLILSGPEGIDHTHKNREATDQYTSTIQIPKPSSVGQSLPQTHTFPPCNCVQQLTEQLANFKALRRSRHLLWPDFVLTVARDALAGWRNHLQCPTCQHSNDKDIMILSVMALRSLLNLIQDNQHEHQSPYNDTGCEMPARDTSSPPVFNSDHSFLGTYRLACEEKRLVVDLLLHRTLRSLNRTIEHLRQKSLRMVSDTPRRNAIPNQLSRSHSSLPTQQVVSSSICYDLPDDTAVSEGTDELNSAGVGMSLDEHDNYLQRSLQSSSATIESLLMKIQATRMSQGPNGAEMFAF